MKPKKPYRKGDKILVKSFAGPDVRVILEERYIASQSEHKLGVDGWNARLVYKKDIDMLRKHGVPYKKDEKPKVWVFDWQIIKKCN